MTETADAAAWQAGYGASKQEAHNVEPADAPEAVNRDGWAASRQAWQTLFAGVVILRCYWHGWLALRDRGKHLGDVVGTLAEEVWHAHYAPPAAALGSGGGDRASGRRGRRR